MEGRLIVLFATLTVFVASGIQGTAHLSFATNNEVNITRDGCGITKLCLETPEDCDPATNATCLFASIVASEVVAPNGTNLSVELRGESMGYIAMGLTQNASEGTSMLFICAQNMTNNGTFLFRTGSLNNTNGMVSLEEITVTEIRGMVKDNVIRCEFDIPHVNATQTRNSEVTTFVVRLGNGSLTSDGLGFGAFTTNFDSSRLNIADPASNIATTTMAPSNMTTVPATTASSGAVHPHALLILLTVLILAMLRA